MLSALLRKFRGRPELTPYEREVLEKEYQRLSLHLIDLDSHLGTVQCASCVKVEEVGANRIIAKKRAIKKTLDDIAWKLGYEPDVVVTSKRGQRAGR